MTQQTNINVIAACNALGYGIAGFNVVNTLINKQVNTSFWPIGNIEIPCKHSHFITNAILNARQYDVYAPCVKIWHAFGMDMFVGRGKKIGWPIFELDTLDPTSVNYLSNIDEIIVCCNHNKQVIEAHNIRLPIHVVPLGVNRDIFNETNSQFNDDTCIFCNIGKWEVRKGHDIIIKAFLKAFSKDDDVQLWMMTDNPFLNSVQKNQWASMYKNNELGDKVLLIRRVKYMEDVANIVKKTDCGVFPARGEGFNLELLEFMSCGKHVICTDFGAHKDYVNTENSMIIHIDDMEPAYDSIWGYFRGQGNWGKLTDKHVEQIADYMREIYLMKKKGFLSLNEAGIETAKKMTWNDTVDKMLVAIK